VIALEHIKFDFGRDPAIGELMRSPYPLAGLRGPTSKGEGREKRKRRGTGKEGKGKERKGRTPLRKFLDPPLPPTHFCNSSVVKNRLEYR